MATKLSVQGLLKLFNTGQGLGAGTYVNYAADHDFNYGIIESTVDTLVDEVRALGGPNSLIQLDLVKSTLPAVATGILDSNSFAASFSTTTDPDDTITIQPGSALTTAGRRELILAKVMVGSGTTGGRWVALHDDNTVTTETAAAQGVMDLFSVDWVSGAGYTTATLLLLPSIMPAGDDFQNCLITSNVATAGAGLPDNETYQRIANKLEDIDRILKGSTTTSDAIITAALGRIAISGAVGTPGIVLSDGTTPELTTGFFRKAADELGLSVLGTELFNCSEDAANEPQMFMRLGTTIGRPPIGWEGDGDSGLGYVSSDVWRLIAGGAEVLRIESDGNPHAYFPLAAVGNPALGPLDDPDTGFYSDGADQLNFGTGGVEAMRMTDDQQIHSDTQFRFDVSTTAEALASSGTPSPVSMDTEITDIGAFGSVPDASWVVPSGGAGWYQITGYITFDESTSITPNIGNIRIVALQIDGTTVSEGRDEPHQVVNQDESFAVSHGMELADAAVITLEAAQDSGNSMDVSGRLSAVRIW